MLVVRHLDHQRDQNEIARLLAHQPIDLRTYHPELVAGMPEGVRRYFNFAIKPGTPLLPVARLHMQGLMRLGSQSQSTDLRFTATQVLACPYGFIWKVRSGSGCIRVSGSDSGTWTRFWLYGIIPVARTGDNTDHEKSAFGRTVAEALFWSPAALLPGDRVSWSQPGPDTIRAHVVHNDLSQTIEMTINDNGRPDRVVFSRWSNANQQRQFQQQPFGGTLSVFKEFGGYQLPTRVEAGNFFGTDAYFPFFTADVTEIEFPLQTVH